MEIEKLDVINIIEIERIREILNKHPDLLSIFEILCLLVNNKINTERVDSSSPSLEDNTEPTLTSDSDEELDYGVEGGMTY